MSSRQERRTAARAAAKQARRAEINRQNAQQSTGPNSAQGKSNSSRNSFKHGLYSQQLCHTPEEAVALDALKADLRAEYQPGTTTEELLANEMAEQYWRIKRARRYEAAILNCDGEISHLAVCQRMMSAAERGFHKALATLRNLQAERGVDEAAPLSEPKTQQDLPQPVEQAQTEPETASGFVPQNEPELSFEADPFADLSPFSQPSAPRLGPHVTAALERIMQRRTDASGFVPQNPELIESERPFICRSNERDTSEISST